LLGGNGFIGSRLISPLNSAGNEVIIASRNPSPTQLKITPGESLEIELGEFDLVINAAGKYGVKDSKEEINLTNEANMAVCTTISKSIHLISKGVINFSSYFENLPQTSPTKNLYYTKSKIAGNNILKNSCEANNKAYSRIILFDNYDKNLSRGKVLDKLIEAAVKNEFITIKNIENALNLSSVDQISDATVKIAESFKTSQPLMGRIDIKNEKSYKIIELIHKIEDLNSKKLQFTDLSQPIDYELQKVILEKRETEKSINLVDLLPTYLTEMLRGKA
jgi:nucleoside-diphosphate-sugar epimerase